MSEDFVTEMNLKIGQLCEVRQQIQDVWARYDWLRRQAEQLERRVMRLFAINSAEITHAADFDEERAARDTEPAPAMPRVEVMP